jgi:hypothetical protein
MVGQALSREKAFVPGPGTMMISSHQLSIKSKGKWPFVSKLIPGESPAHDASFCIWKQFRNDFVDSATVTSLPTVSQPAVLLPRGVNGNTQLVPVLQEVADMSSPRFLVSGRC